MATTTLDIIVQMNIQAAKAELYKLRNIVNRLNNKDFNPKDDIYKYKGLRKAMQTANKAKDELGKNNPITKEANARVERMAKDLNLSANAMAKMRDRTKAFNFNFLTLLFVGMLIQRTFGKLFNNIIDSYKRIMGLNSEFTKHLLKLRASFGYLKFAIANALNSPAIIRGIEWFTDRIVMLGDYLAEHPNMSLTILGIISALLVIGKLASIASGVIQLGMLIKIAGSTKAATAIKNLTKLGNSSKLLSNVADSLGVSSISEAAVGIIGVIALFTELFALLNNNKSVRDWAVNNLTGITKYITSFVESFLKGYIGIAEIATIFGKVVFKEWKVMFSNLVDIAKTSFDIIKLSWKLLWGFIKGEDKKTLDGYRTQIKDDYSKILSDTKDILNLYTPKSISSYFTDQDTFNTMITFGDLLKNITKNGDDLRKGIDDTFGDTLKQGLDSIITTKNYIAGYFNPTITSLDSNINQNLNNSIKIFNKGISDNTNVILPNQKQAMQNQFSTLDTLAAKINNAAAAQERYNRAVHNHSTHNSGGSPGHTTIPINHQSMSIAPSLSTSTQTSGVYFNSSGLGFSSAFGNPNGD